MNESMQQRHIESNRLEYGLKYDLLTFADPEQLAAAVAERKELLQWLERRARFGYAGTKVDCNGLSPGCRCCGDGGWSCLFVNGRCNGHCFYCPTAQDDDGPPVTNGLAFTTPEDYAAYVAALGFSGVSISGGEPLMTPDLTAGASASSDTSTSRRACPSWSICFMPATTASVLSVYRCRPMHTPRAPRARCRG